MKTIIFLFATMAISISVLAFPIQPKKTFTCSPGSFTVVSDPEIRQKSTILLNPENESASTLQKGKKKLKLDKSSIVSGVSFKMVTSDGTIATGNEIFSYMILTE